MRSLVFILCIGLTFYTSVAHAIDGLATCPGFEARAEKVRKFDLRSKLLNKNVKSLPGDSVNWFAGGWGVDNEGGHVPSGSTKHQNFGFSLWPLHGPTVNSDDPRNHPANSLNWKSISITCSGANCQFTNLNIGTSAFYTCEAPGTTIFTATGTYLDDQGNEVAAISTPYVINCSNTAPIAGFKFLSSGTTGQYTFAHSDEDARDPDNGLGNYYLGYHYFITKAPPRSRPILEDANSGTSKFIPDLPGNYELTLVVDDCVTYSQPFAASIKIGGEGCDAVRAKHKKRDPISRKASFLDSDGQTCSAEDQLDDDGNGCVSCRLGMLHSRYPVNIATGAMWHNNTDFVVPGRTPETALAMSRNYTANAPGPAGELGPNWRHAYEMSLFALTNQGWASGNIEWIDENGNPFIFTRNVNNSLNSPRGSRLQIRELTDSIEITKPNKTVLTFSKTPYGKLMKIKERHGEEVNFSYDTNGLLSTVTSPFAGTLSFTHNESGKISSVTRVRDNLTYTYDYDSNGRLATVTDFAGKTYKYTYITNMPGTYANGMLETITDPLGRVLTFKYDEKGRASEQYTSGGGKSTFAYSESLPRTTVVKDIDGTSTVYKFDKNFRTTETRKSDGGIIRQSWNDAGFLSSYTDELGFTTSYSYDANGNVTSVQRPADSQPTITQYDPNFNVPVMITPALGAITHFTLDPNTGEVMQKSRDALPNVLELNFTRDSFGNLLSVSNGLATYGDQRDANGLLTQKFDLHNPETRTYDSRGRVVARTFQSGHVLQYTYDDYDRVINKQDNAGPSISFEFDAMGRVLKQTVSDNHKSQVTTYSWDEHDRLLSKKDPLGRVTRYQYEKWRIISSPIAIIDPAGRSTKFEYDALGRMTKKIDAKGAATAYVLDQRGNITSETDALGNITSYSYDGNGRKIAETRPSMQGTTAVQQTTRFTYDDADNLLNASHESTSGLPNRNEVYVYDGFNRLLKKTLLNDGSVNETNYTYEPQLDANNLHSVNNEIANLSFAHEAAPPFAVIGFSQSAAQSGNPLQLMEDQFVVGRDGTGNISSVSGNALGQIYTKTYDIAGRLVNVDAGALKAGIRYDNFGRKSGSGFSTGEVSTTNYDLLNRVTDVKWKERSINSAEEYLKYDIAGNIAEISRENAHYQLSYDGVDQLVTSKHRALSGISTYSRQFDYDLVGNRISDSVNGSAKFESGFLMSNNGSAFEADPYGFGQVAKESSANDVRQYAFRADGRIVAYQDSRTHANYFYDGLDRLVAKSLQVDGSQFQQSYVNLTDEDHVLLGKAGDGTVTAYIDGQDIADHLGEVKGGSAKGYITDHIGSVLNSPLAGVGRAYGLFGEPTAKYSVGQASAPVVYGYAGHFIDIESGLSRTKYRQYAPSIGRWLTREPRGKQGPNLYSYSKNNPIKFKDSDGLTYVSLTGGGGGLSCSEISQKAYTACAEGITVTTLAMEGPALAGCGLAGPAAPECAGVVGCTIALQTAAGNLSCGMVQLQAFDSCVADRNNDPNDDPEFNWNAVFDQLMNL